MKRHRTPTLQPKRLPIHWESQHLQGRLERSVRSLSLPANDTVARRDILPSCCDIPCACSCATPARFVNDLEVEDNPTSLDFSRLDSTVEDADGLGERGDVHAGGEAARVGKRRCHGI